MIEITPQQLTNEYKTIIKNACLEDDSLGVVRRFLTQDFKAIEAQLKNNAPVVPKYIKELRRAEQQAQINPSDANKQLYRRGFPKLLALLRRVHDEMKTSREKKIKSRYSSKPQLLNKVELIRELLGHVKNSTITMLNSDDISVNYIDEKKIKQVNKTLNDELLKVIDRSATIGDVVVGTRVKPSDIPNAPVVSGT